MPPKRKRGPVPNTPPHAGPPQFTSPGTEAAAALLILLSQGSKRFSAPTTAVETPPPVSREMAAWQSGIDGAAASPRDPPTPTSARLAKSGRVCNFCGKQCPDSSKLAIHERVHTGEKPFGCSACDKRFSDRGNAVRHTKTHALGRAVTVVAFATAPTPSPDHAAAAGADDDHFGASSFGASSTAGDTDSVGDSLSGWSSTSSTASSSVASTPVRRLSPASQVQSKKGQKAGMPTAKKLKRTQPPAPATTRELTAGEKPFGCAFCEKRFTRKVNAAQHERAHRS